MKKFTMLIFSLIIVNGCTKDVDFNQINDAELNPTYVFTVIHFTKEARDLLDPVTGGEILIHEDKIDHYFNPDIERIEEYLEKVEFTVETENEFNRDFKLTIDFLDSSGTIFYTLYSTTSTEYTVFVPKESSAQRVVIEIPKADIANIFDAEVFKFTTYLSGDGPTIVPVDPSVLYMRSYFELTFKINEI